MTAKIVRQWLASVGAQTLYIAPGNPWENGYCEGFNGMLRDERLNGEIFYSPKEAQSAASRLATQCVKSPWCGTKPSWAQEYCS